MNLIFPTEKLKQPVKNPAKAETLFLVVAWDVDWARWSVRKGEYMSLEAAEIASKQMAPRWRDKYILKVELPGGIE